MDAVAGLLDGPRARDAFLLRSTMDPPWSIRIEDEAPLTVVALVRGEAWVMPDGGGEPIRFGPGDVAVGRGPSHYLVADDPATPPQAVIRPGQTCAAPDGRPLMLMKELGVRTWGNSAAGATVMLTGTYALEGEVSGRLLRALPALIHLTPDAWDCPLVPLLADEIVKDAPGQEAVLDRLLDLLLIAVLRAWFARTDGGAPGWYRAAADPIVGPALRLMYAASRAAFARRLAALVGEPPMSFLTGWRIALAADLLREPGATIASVAPQVGYGSPFALSAAFTRVRGISPRRHRETAA